MPGPSEVFGGAKVHGNQQSLDIRSMVDLYSLEGFELPGSPRNLVWLRSQGLIVGDHLIEIGRHI